MPIISVTMGPTSKAQKKEMIEKLTATAVEITKIPAQAFSVTITELAYENLGLAGRTVEEIMKEKG